MLLEETNRKAEQELTAKERYLQAKKRLQELEDEKQELEDIINHTNPYEYEMERC